MTKDVIVVDSSPLISLAVIEQLELLPQLYQDVLIPSAVWNEVTVKGSGLPGANTVRQKQWLQIRTIEKGAVEPIIILVDRGEAEVIALSQSVPKSTVLLDDAQARRVAKRLGLSCIGTLGVLRKAKKAGLISEVSKYARQLQSCGIYIRNSLVEAVLRDVGEIE